MVNVKLDEFKRINKDGNVMLLCYDVEKVHSHKVKKNTHTHTQSQKVNIRMPTHKTNR